MNDLILPFICSIIVTVALVWLLWPAFSDFLKKLPPVVDDKGGYDCPDSCNACGGVNETRVVDSIDYRPTEMTTVCKDCGHEDYWSYGRFESGQDMVSKCRKYK